MSQSVQSALSKIHAPQGLTSLISGIMADDFSVFRDPKATGRTLDDARAELKRSEKAQADAKSDWAYWSYQGVTSYWRAVVDILEAATIVGDELLDITPKQAVVLMDECAAVEKYGRAILDDAKRRSPTPPAGGTE